MPLLYNRNLLHIQKIHFMYNVLAIIWWKPLCLPCKNRTSQSKKRRKRDHEYPA